MKIGHIRYADPTAPFLFPPSPHQFSLPPPEKTKEKK